MLAVSAPAYACMPAYTSNHLKTIALMSEHCQCHIIVSTSIANETPCAIPNSSSFAVNQRRHIDFLGFSRSFTFAVFRFYASGGAIFAFVELCALVDHSAWPPFPALLSCNSFLLLRVLPTQLCSVSFGAWHRHPLILGRHVIATGRTAW